MMPIFVRAPRPGAVGEPRRATGSAERELSWIASPTGRRGLVLPLAVLVVAAFGACRKPPGPRYPGAPIVLLSIDTLRADHLPLYGYRGVETPGIDRLARDGIAFDNAYSHYPLTLPSHVSLLTGLLPPEHGVRDNSGYRFDASSHPFLPRLLDAAGYATGGFVSAFVLRAETGLAAGFGHYDSEIEIEPGGSLDSGQRPGLETTARAVAWVREQGSRPFLLFLHLYEPHAPYDPPEPFASRYAGQPYDGEIATADIVLDGLFDELERQGIYRRALIVLVADHGEGLGDHGERQHGIFLYRSTVHVPLIVKLPDGARAGTRVGRPVGLVDVVPTLLALAGVEAPAGLSGRSLVAEADETSDRQAIYAESYVPRLHYGWSDLQAAYEERWAYVDAPAAELYDLEADPGQERNVLTDRRRETARLRGIVESIDRPLVQRQSVDAETAAQLAALGYLSGPVAAADGPLPDPKSQRELITAIEDAFEAFADERHSEAVVRLRAVLAENDGMFDVWTRLARSLHEIGDEEQSVAAWERALELSGGAPDIALRVAAGKLLLRRYDDARALAELGRAADAQTADEILIEADLASGRSTEAFRRIEKAVSEGRASESSQRRLAALRRQQGAADQAVALLAPKAASGETATRIVYALALSDLGRHQEALAVLDSLRPENPESAPLLAALGTVLLRTDRALQARQALERSVALDPNRADAWNTLGVARYRTAGPRPAMVAWQRALALDPERYDVLFNLGIVALEAGDRRAARQALERFVERAPREHFAADIETARQALGRLKS